MSWSIDPNDLGVVNVGIGAELSSVNARVQFVPALTVNDPSSHIFIMQ
jgi:hypothetical protein